MFHDHTLKRVTSAFSSETGKNRLSSEPKCSAGQNLLLGKMKLQRFADD